MNIEKQKKQKRERRQKRTRAKISGTGKRPRLNIYKSNKAIYAQLIDDVAGKTLLGINSTKVEDKGTKTEIAFNLGKMIAQEAKSKKIEEIVFDKGGFRFQGRVKALADGAREGGLKF